MMLRLQTTPKGSSCSRSESSSSDVQSSLIGNNSSMNIEQLMFPLSNEDRRGRSISLERNQHHAAAVNDNLSVKTYESPAREEQGNHMSPLSSSSRRSSRIQSLYSADPIVIAADEDVQSDDYGRHNDSN